MGKFLGITGTPGTGKKSIAGPVAAALGVPSLSINEITRQGQGRPHHQVSHEVDSESLRRRLVRRAGGRCVVYGHLLPHVLEKGEVARVVVLRCNPETLRERLSLRGYSRKKVSQNVEAELIGLIYADSVSKYGKAKVYEFDTTSTSIREATVAVAALFARRGERAAPIDWLEAYDSAEKLRSLLSADMAESART